jgi:hypothetical protein
MTRVFNDAIRNGSVFSVEQLTLMKEIFDELCVEHNLTREVQPKRDILARAIVEVGRISSDESVLRMVGLRALIDC